MHCIPAASRIWYVMKMVNNLVCLLNLSSQRALNYFANWLCEVSTWEPLCSSAKCSQSAGSSTGPAQFPESLETKQWVLGRTEQRRKMRDSEMTFNVIFLCLCPVWAEQLCDCVQDVRLHAVIIKQTTSVGADGTLGVTHSLCTEIRVWAWSWNMLSPYDSLELRASLIPSSLNRAL